MLFFRKNICLTAETGPFLFGTDCMNRSDPCLTDMDVSFWEEWTHAGIKKRACLPQRL